MKKTINSQEFRAAIAELEDQAYDMFGGDIRVTVDTWIDPEDELPVAPVINWAATGDKSIAETAEFASKLQRAVELAAGFPYNGAMARWDEQAETMFFDLDTDDPDDDPNDDDDDDFGIIFDLHAGQSLIDSADPWHDAMECDFTRWEEDFGGTLETTRAMGVAMDFADEINEETNDMSFSSITDATGAWAFNVLETVAKIEALNDFIKRTACPLNPISGRIIIVDKRDDEEILRKGTIADGAGTVAEYIIGAGSRWVTVWDIEDDEEGAREFNEDMRENDEEGVREFMGMYTRELDHKNEKGQF